MIGLLDYDVVVAGAGSAGCIAAIAAARGGARTVLVDRLAFPGGTSTAVLDTFYAFFTAGDEGRKVVSGLPDEPVEALRQRGAVVERPNSFGSGLGYTYNPEVLKLVWSELLAAAGVEVATHMLLVTAERERDGRVRSVGLASRAGMVEAIARTFVDATGDADLVAVAGGAFQPDREPRQPSTLTFRVTGVDLPAFRAEGRPRFRELVRQGRAAGLRLDGEGGSLHASVPASLMLVSTTRTPSPDYGDPLAPGRMEREGLRQVDEWLRFLRRFVPGMQGAELVSIGALSGVRETRRILGRATLREEHVLAGAHPSTEIARCGAPIEDLAANETRWVHVGGGGDYGIPWEALLPQGLPNVVVAGRCLSATHAAHASARSMATCMAMGQAAGTAAGLALTRDVEIAEVEPGAIQDELIRNGADIVRRVEGEDGAT